MTTLKKENRRILGRLSLVMKHCICYKVNPDQLNAGIPIENLEKTGYRTIGETEQNLARTGITGLSRHQQFTDKPRAKFAASRPILRLISEDYAAATHGKSIRVPAHFCHLIGREICLINEYSRSHKVMRLHEIIGDRGYFL